MKVIALNSAGGVNVYDSLRSTFNDLNGSSIDPSRADLYKILGYPHTITPQMYHSVYQRNDIAQRIIDALPNDIWSRAPRISEGDDEDDNRESTEFESRFKRFAYRTKLFNILSRVDKLSSLGRYSILVLGVRNSGATNRALNRIRSIDDVIYLMPYGEVNVEMREFETSRFSSRFGLPRLYRIRIDGTNHQEQTFVDVHYSRVIHVADGLLENNVYGTPRLRSIWNRLMDLEKVVGSASELYWSNGQGIIAVNVESDANFVDPDALNAHIEEVLEKRKRTLLTQGADISKIESTIHDPHNLVNILLDLISGAVGIPKRILVGSERGEMSSSQDENNWYARMIERRSNFCEPCILRPLIDRLMELGGFPSVEEYQVVWEDKYALSEQDSADRAFKVAQAISVYANSVAYGGNKIVPESQFVKEILKVRDESQEISPEDVVKSTPGFQI